LRRNAPGVVHLVHEVINIYRYVVFAAIIASWVAPGSNHPLVVFLHRVTEPLLAPIRKVLPDLGGIDISPIVLLLALQILQKLI
jgi:YggT family protein